MYFANVSNDICPVCLWIEARPTPDSIAGVTNPARRLRPDTLCGESSSSRPNSLTIKLTDCACKCGAMRCGPSMDPHNAPCLPTGVHRPSGTWDVAAPPPRRFGELSLDPFWSAVIGSKPASRPQQVVDIQTHQFGSAECSRETEPDTHLYHASRLILLIDSTPAATFGGSPAAVRRRTFGASFGSLWMPRDN